MFDLEMIYLLIMFYWRGICIIELDICIELLLRALTRRGRILFLMVLRYAGNGLLSF